MKAPDKLYVDTKDRLSDSILYGFTEKRKDDDIEYVRKDALVAEIKKKLDKYNKLQSFNYGAVKDLESLLNFLDTFEVKEVDLEKEIELVKGDYKQVDVAWNNDFDFIARHFFELGLKTKKGG